MCCSYDGSDFFLFSFLNHNTHIFVIDFLNFFWFASGRDVTRHHLAAADAVLQIPSCKYIVSLVLYSSLLFFTRLTYC